MELNKIKKNNINKSKKPAMALVLIIIILTSVTFVIMGTMKIITSVNGRYSINRNAKGVFNIKKTFGRYICYLTPEGNLKSSRVTYNSDGSPNEPEIKDGCIFEIPDGVTNLNFTLVGGGAAGALESYRTLMYRNVTNSNKDDTINEIAATYDGESDRLASNKDDNDFYRNIDIKLEHFNFPSSIIVNNFLHYDNNFSTLGSPYVFNDNLKLKELIDNTGCIYNSTDPTQPQYTVLCRTPNIFSSTYECYDGSPYKIVYNEVDCDNSLEDNIPKLDKNNFKLVFSSKDSIFKNFSFTLAQLKTKTDANPDLTLDNIIREKLQSLMTTNKTCAYKPYFLLNSYKASEPGDVKQTTIYVPYLKKENELIIKATNESGECSGADACIGTGEVYKLSTFNINQTKTKLNLKYKDEYNTVAKSNRYLETNTAQKNTNVLNPSYAPDQLYESEFKKMKNKFGKEANYSLSPDFKIPNLNVGYVVEPSSGSITPSNIKPATLFGSSGPVIKPTDYISFVGDKVKYKLIDSSENCAPLYDSGAPANTCELVLSDGEEKKLNGAPGAIIIEW